MTYLAAFDWNGTLFDDTSATLVATNVALAAFNVAPIDLHVMQETFTFPLIHFYEKMGVSADAYLARAEQEGRAYVDAYEAHCHTCEIATGAFELLEWLNAKDVHCMILSNHLQHKLDHDVAKLGITPYMKCVSGNLEWGTMAQGLSKQIRLEAYMKEHGFAADKTFIIGDSHEEAELAKRLGILGISMAGGLLSAARLEKYKADYIVQRLAEVRPILENHWKL